MTSPCHIDIYAATTSPLSPLLLLLPLFLPALLLQRDMRYYALPCYFFRRQQSHHGLAADIAMLSSALFYFAAAIFSCFHAAIIYAADGFQRYAMRAMFRVTSAARL